MNRHDALERELTAWFVDTAAPRVPDYTTDIVQLTATVRQRPRWTFSERWLPMSVITLARRSIRPVPWRTVGLLALLALLISASIAVYIGSHQRRPEPFGPAVNGDLAFATAGDILVVDPATGETRMVVGGPDIDDYPTFSRDGSRITFERTVGNTAQLFVVNATGGQPEALTEPDPLGIFGLTWSPGDTSVVYINGHLWVVAADGSGAKAVDATFQATGYPVWRPTDGRDIAVQGIADATGKEGWYLVRPDGSALRSILLPGGRILAGGPYEFTPDGTRFIGLRQAANSSSAESLELHVMTLGEDGRVTDDRRIGPTVGSNVVGYTLSPDGSRFVVSIPQLDGGWRAAVIAIDGSSGVIETGPVFEGTEFGVAWSPDGRSVLVNDTVQHETWLLDPSGGTEHAAPWSAITGDLPAWQRRAR